MILFVETLKKLAEPLHYGVLFHFFLAQYVLFWAAVCLQSPPMKLTLFGTLAHVYIEWTLKGLPEWLCFIDVSVEESESDNVFERVKEKFGPTSSWIGNKKPDFLYRKYSVAEYYVHRKSSTSGVVPVVWRHLPGINNGFSQTLLGLQQQKPQMISVTELPGGVKEVRTYQFQPERVVG